MSLQTVKELIKEAGWGTLVTTDGEEVGCRHWWRVSLWHWRS